MYRLIKKKINNFGAIGCDMTETMYCSNGYNKTDPNYNKICCECESPSGDGSLPRSCAYSACYNQKCDDSPTPQPTQCNSDIDCDSNQICKNGRCKSQPNQPPKRVCIDGYLYKYSGYPCN